MVFQRRGMSYWVPARVVPGAGHRMTLSVVVMLSSKSISVLDRSSILLSLVSSISSRNAFHGVFVLYYGVFLGHT